MAPALRLGRLPRARYAGVPHLSALLAGKTLPPPPSSIDRSTQLPAPFGMMLNDQLGDCTCAGVYHALQVWTSLANPPRETEPDSNVELLYEQACGYKPDDASTDQGGVEQDVLTYLLNTGAPMGANGNQRHKIDAFVEVDPRNMDDVKRTIADCGLAYIGFNVPSWLPMDANSDWDTRPGKPQIIGGHCVILVGYDLMRTTVISWGQYYTMTWRFFAQFVDECYGIIDPLWTEKTGKTPYGLTEADTVSAMLAIKEAA